jgi:cation-transporting P-type ATPase 13A2
MDSGDASGPERRPTEGSIAPNGHPPLYRLNSNHSSTSIYEDVEMAQDEVNTPYKLSLASFSLTMSPKLFSGPVAESLPTSVSAFSHRRTRADSTTSFTYYDEDETAELVEPEGDGDSRRHSLASEYTRRSFSDLGDLEFGDIEEDDSADQGYEAAQEDYVMRRRSSTHSRSSVHARLLRTDSAATGSSARGLGRTSQKVYMVNEDLTIAVAGFRTSALGFLIYILLCTLTGGLAYLLFRWVPRWYVAVVGKHCPLRNCTWVVVENQWGEMVVMTPNVQLYGRPLSTVFGQSNKVSEYDLDDMNDPIMDELRSLDYRYVRLCFHPLKDKFLLATGWKDPGWTDVYQVRSGLDADEKSVRETIFGNNLIDIEQKSVGTLLVDEVMLRRWLLFSVVRVI